MSYVVFCMESVVYWVGIHEWAVIRSLVLKVGSYRSICCVLRVGSY